MKKFYIQCRTAIVPHYDGGGRICGHETSPYLCESIVGGLCPYLLCYPVPPIYKRLWNATIRRLYYKIRFRLDWDLILFSIRHPVENKRYDKDAKERLAQSDIEPSTEMKVTYDQWFNSLPPVFQKYELSKPEEQQRKQDWERLDKFKKWFEEYSYVK